MVKRLVSLFSHDIRVKEYMDFTYIIYRYFLFDFCRTKKRTYVILQSLPVPQYYVCYVLVNQSDYFAKWLYSMSDYELIVLYPHKGPWRIFGWHRHMHYAGNLLIAFFLQWSVDSLRPRLNRRPFTSDIFKCIFLNENACILPRNSLTFVPMVRMSTGCWENVWVAIYLPHNLCCCMCSTDSFKFGWSERYVNKSVLSCNRKYQSFLMLSYWYRGLLFGYLHQYIMSVFPIIFPFNQI